MNIPKPYRETSNERKQQIMNQLEKSVKYNMFTTFDDSANIDDEIVDLEDSVFSKVIKTFNNRLDYYDAICEMENLVSDGKDIPEELLKKVTEARKSYMVYKKKHI